MQGKQGWELFHTTYEYVLQQQPGWTIVAAIRITEQAIKQKKGKNTTSRTRTCDLTNHRYFIARTLRTLAQLQLYREENKRSSGASMSLLSTQLTISIDRRRRKKSVFHKVFYTRVNLA